VKWIALLVIGVTTVATAMPQPRRIAIVSPRPLAMTGVDGDLALSPDGTRIVYVGGGAGGQLTIRAIGDGRWRTFGVRFRTDR
jgi:hypothetical protein